MYDSAHVPLVQTHAERHSGHHDTHTTGHETVLHGLAGRIGQACVITSRTETVGLNMKGEEYGRGVIGE